jgi:L-aspartate oxidase
MPEASRSAGNALLSATAIVAAASIRRESRGCHWRSDYPARNDWWRRRVALRLDETGAPVVFGNEPIGRTA